MDAIERNLPAKPRDVDAGVRRWMNAAYDRDA